MHELHLSLRDKSFFPIVLDTENVLQNLIKNMVEKKSYEGSVTLKLEIDLVEQAVEDTILGTRIVLVPNVSHKVSSVMQVKSEIKGGQSYDDYELVLNDLKDEYVMRRIDTGIEQMEL